MPSRNATVCISPQGEIEVRGMQISECVLLQYARGKFAIFVQILRGFPLGETLRDAAKAAPAETDDA